MSADIPRTWISAMAKKKKTLAERRREYAQQLARNAEAKARAYQAAAEDPAIGLVCDAVEKVDRIYCEVSDPSFKCEKVLLDALNAARGGIAKALKEVEVIVELTVPAHLATAQETADRQAIIEARAAMEASEAKLRAAGIEPSGDLAADLSAMVERLARADKASATAAARPPGTDKKGGKA